MNPTPDQAGSLLPCAFCGGSAAMQEIERCDVGLSFPDHYVQCNNCGASGPVGGPLGAGKQQAADLWNRRALPAPVRGELTDEQIDVIFKAHHNVLDNPWTNWRRFARAILAASAPKGQAE